MSIDRPTDVALLRIAAINLPVVTIGHSSEFCAGEWVAAMGAPFGFEGSVTAGVVGAHPRYMLSPNARARWVSAFKRPDLYVQGVSGYG